MCDSPSNVEVISLLCCSTAVVAHIQSVVASLPRMKKLLVITYYWPPSGGAGVQRWLKFVKYLAQMGWEIHVITVDDAVATYPHRDASLPVHLEGNVTIHRTNTSEPYRYYSMLSGGKVPSAGFANETTGSSTGMLKRFARFVRGNVFIPDPRKGWNSYAIKTAKEIIDANGIQVVVTTSPPHSTQLIGLELKKCRDIKWIADMRDPWTGIYYASELLQTAWAERQNAKMEREVLHTADHIITVSNQLKRDFLKLASTLSPDRISVIPNGYDADDFKELMPVQKEFTIGYMGTITGQYDISALLKVLAIMRQKVGLRFTGEVPFDIQTTLKATGHNCEFTGYLTHDEALQRASSCAMLLLVIPKVDGNKGIVTGKIFEYLALQRPIIGIGPVDGDAAEILKETGAGEMVDYEDKERITSVIQAILQNGFSIKRIGAEAYSRLGLSKQLNQILVKFSN